MPLSITSDNGPPFNSAEYKQYLTENSINGVTELIYDQEVRDRDAECKGIAKNYAEVNKGAKESDVKVDDLVLVKGDQPNKLDAPFKPEPFRVVDKRGSNVTVQSPQGVCYDRNTHHVKQFVTASGNEATVQPSSGDSDNQNDIDTEIEQPGGRPRRVVKPPVWSNDYEWVCTIARVIKV